MLGARHETTGVLQLQDDVWCREAAAETFPESATFLRGFLTIHEVETADRGAGSKEQELQMSEY